MTTTKAVFFDGIPGSGKTTLAYWLGDKLQSRNINNRVFDEVCEDHPLRIYDPIYTDFTLSTQSDDFREKTTHLYKKFVQTRVNDKTISIFDGWLFQATIGFTFLLRMDMSESTDFGFQLMEILSILEPIIVYVKQTDVEMNWRRICEIRGSDFSEGRCDFSEDIDYVKAGIAWSANQEFCVSLLRKSGTRHLIIENSDYDYAVQRQEIADFLEISQLDDASTQHI